MSCRAALHRIARIIEEIFCTLKILLDNRARSYYIARTLALTPARKDSHMPLTKQELRMVGQLLTVLRKALASSVVVVDQIWQEISDPGTDSPS